MRFPNKLIGVVDRLINNDYLYTTRPDFILDAVRFTYGKLSEKYADVYEKTSMAESAFALYKGRENELMQMSGDVLLSNYRDYGQETVQVMVRLPKGLVDKIEKNLVGIGFCKNRTDFVRIATVYKLSYITELENLWKKAETYNRDAGKKLRNTAVDAILKDFNDKTMFETAKEVSKKFDDADKE